MKKRKLNPKKQMSLRQKAPPSRQAEGAMSIEGLLARAAKARKRSPGDIDLSRLSRKQIIEAVRKTPIRSE